MTKKYFSIMTTMGKIDVAIEAEILYEVLSNTYLNEYEAVIQLAYIAHTVKPEYDFFEIDDWSQWLDPNDVKIIGDHTNPFSLWESSNMFECDEKGNILE